MEGGTGEQESGGCVTREQEVPGGQHLGGSFRVSRVEAEVAFSGPTAALYFQK